ncbi:hypothetical protein ACFWAY_32575 [Rhodococcus sp. NPDC059968]|uniref:hypothetical protein n=1 Tax=Rhodococcus sp. NPDC059968 TaxID=3347017 RepID=UPI00366DC41B
MTAKRLMLLATYNISKDRTEEDYDKFCREVDTPFYNSIPGVVRYSNWKVVEENLGSVGFKYIDFIVVEGDEPFKMFEDNQKIKDFIVKWEEQWAEFGTDEQYLGKNYQIVKLEEVAAPD